MLVVAFKNGLACGFNGGIVASIGALNTVYIIIATFFMFGERFNIIKILAIVLFITSVIIISLFGPT